MMRPQCLRSGFVAAALFAAPSTGHAAATAWTGDAHAAVRLVTADDGSGTASVSAGIEFRFAPSWHGYWRTPGDAGVPPTFDWSGTPGLKDASVAWPAPVRLVVAGLQNIVYDGRVTLPVTLSFTNPVSATEIRVAVDYAACSNICVPYHADLTLGLPAAAGPPSAEAPLIAAAREALPRTPAASGFTVSRQALLGTGADRKLVVDLASPTVPFARPDLFVENAGDGIPPAPTVALGDGGRVATLTVSLPEIQEGDSEPSAMPRSEPLMLTLVDGARSASFTGPVLSPTVGHEGGDLWAALLSALFGGLILNLMPCVLPVLSLKLAGLASQAGESRRAVRFGFAATGLGIVTSFLALAVALIGLKGSGAALGWGIQFQQPWFLGMLAAVTVIFAASLFDWVTIGMPAGAARLGGGRSRGKLIEAFLAGAFATVLATPCSAPFVGTAVGFALARGTDEILTVFLCLGVGMAMPFLAAALVPGVVGWLPRPGPWMITLRRFLGLLLIGTTMWLIVVLASVAGALAASAVALILTALLALFGWEAMRPGNWRWGRPAAVALVALAVTTAMAAPSTGAAPAALEGDEVAFDPASLDRLVADGRTVLVDVSASWCLTCKVNELAVLKTAAVRARLGRAGTVVMRADWSRPDVSITRYIQGFGRYGLPLDVVYGPRRPAGEALPELLTATGVIDALDRASLPMDKVGAVP